MDIKVKPEDLLSLAELVYWRNPSDPSAVVGSIYTVTGLNEDTVILTDADGADHVVPYLDVYVLNRALMFEGKATSMDIRLSVGLLVQACHGAAAASGWWTDLETGEPIDVRTVAPEKLMLIVSEVAEAMEGHRKNTMDDHLPNRSMFEVELADAVIRICDLAGAAGLDLGGAIEEKMLYNKNRADHKIENRKKDGGKKY